MHFPGSTESAFDCRLLSENECISVGVRDNKIDEKNMFLISCLLKRLIYTRI